MIVNPKNGVDRLLFGMKQRDVINLYGKPSRQFNDDDDNVIYLYNENRLRLTFYSDEEFRLGYIITSHPETILLGHKVIGQDIHSLKKNLPLKTWEHEEFDSTENYFNESNWLIFQCEFDRVIRIEIGAIILDNDEFDWKYIP